MKIRSPGSGREVFEYSLRRTATAVPSLGEMHLRFLLLADHGEVSPAGLLNLSGGGWEFYEVPRIPWTVRGVVAGIVEFSEVELGEEEQSQPREVTVRYQQGANRLWGGYKVRLEPSRRLLPFVLPFETMVEGHGDFEVIIEDADGPVGQVSCEIRVAASQGGGSEEV